MTDIMPVSAETSQTSVDHVLNAVERILAVPEERAKGRIYFLDVLRAVAVLVVLWGHIFLVGINDPATVSIWVPGAKNLLFGPDTVVNNIHGKLGLFLALKTGLNPGGFGVAIFFLVSGFVILRTIDRSSTVKFLVHRFFRIIPPLFFAVLFVATLTFFYCIINVEPQPTSFKSIIASAFALNYYNGSLPTIPVLWTLEIEMLFYLLMAFVALCVKRISVQVIFTTALLLLTFEMSMVSPLTSDMGPSSLFVLKHISVCCVSINFMLIGSFIYRVYSGEPVGRNSIYGLAITGIYALGVLLHQASSGQNSLGMGFSDTTAALLLFLTALLLGLKGRWFAPLRWVGDISYSLYLIHIPMGWGILVILGTHGWGMNEAALTSTAIVIFVSWLMHKYVEVPSQRLGKRLA